MSKCFCKHGHIASDTNLWGYSGPSGLLLLLCSHGSSILANGVSSPLSGSKLGLAVQFLQYFDTKKILSKKQGTGPVKFDPFYFRFELKGEIYGKPKYLLVLCYSFFFYFQPHVCVLQNLMAEVWVKLIQ